MGARPGTRCLSSRATPKAPTSPSHVTTRTLSRTYCRPWTLKGFMFLAPRSVPKSTNFGRQTDKPSHRCDSHSHSTIRIGDYIPPQRGPPTPIFEDAPRVTFALEICASPSLSGRSSPRKSTRRNAIPPPHLLRHNMISSPPKYAKCPPTRVPSSTPNGALSTRRIGNGILTTNRTRLIMEVLTLSGGRKHQSH